MQLFSPAKVNLSLHVCGKRHDGYHELASLFQAVSFGDTLSIDLQEQDEFVVEPPTEDNLIVRAVTLFRQKTGLFFRVKISIDKQIPMQAGLGGGSSNASTTLWALNELLGRPASLQELKEWGLILGADVPFFFSRGRAFCQGRGEIMQEEQMPTPIPSCTLVKPGYGLSTAAVFMQFTQSDGTGQTPYTNDLEKAAFRMQPNLAQLKENLLQQGFDHVVMSGSGTSFVCIGEGSIPSGLWSKRVLFLTRNEGSWYADTR